MGSASRNLLGSGKKNHVVVAVNLVDVNLKDVNLKDVDHVDAHAEKDN